MADFRLPVHQISATVNGRTYRSDGRGMFVVTDASDIAEFQKLGAVRDGGTGAIPEWNASGTALVGPDGRQVRVAFSSGKQMAAGLGDSITERAFLSSSTAVGYSSYGYASWASTLLHQRIWLPLVRRLGTDTPIINYNRAVSGETSTETLARVPEVLALNPLPQYCYVLTGTNDLTLLTSDSSETIFNRIVAICDALLVGGITPILMTLLPRGNSTDAGWDDLTSGEIAIARQRLLDINRRIRVHASVDPRVIVVDPFYRLINPASATSDPLVALLHDYVHPSPAGAFEIGDEIKTALAPKLGPVFEQAAGTADLWNTSTNPKGTLIDSTWNATGGTASAGVTGDVPLGWTVERLSGSALTAATTLRVRADGKSGKELLLELVGVDAGSFYTFGTANFLGSSNYQPGDGVYTECDIDFTPVTGNSYSSNFFRTSGGTAINVFGMWHDTTGGWLKAFTGRIRTPILVENDANAVTLQGWLVDYVALNAESDVVRRNYVAYKYDRTAAGALTW